MRFRGFGSGTPTAAEMLAPLNLISPTFVKNSVRTSSATDIDFHTAIPTGYRAIIVASSVYCPASPISNHHFQVKRGGTYYQLQADAAMSNGSGLARVSTLSQTGFVMEAGDIPSITNPDGNPVNISAVILLFGDTSGLKTWANLAMSNGDNTLGTVSTGKQAVFPFVGSVITVSGLGGFGGVTAGFVWNASGSARSYNWYHVPSGGSAGSTNQFAALVTQASGARATFTPQDVLSAGDFVVVNTNSGAGTQSGWVTVYEF